VTTKTPSLKTLENATQIGCATSVKYKLAFSFAIRTSNDVIVNPRTKAKIPIAGTKYKVNRIALEICFDKRSLEKTHSAKICHKKAQAIAVMNPNPTMPNKRNDKAARTNKTIIITFADRRNALVNLGAGDEATNSSSVIPCSIRRVSRPKINALRAIGIKYVVHTNPLRRWSPIEVGTSANVMPRAASIPQSYVMDTKRPAVAVIPATFAALSKYSDTVTV